MTGADTDPVTHLEAEVASFAHDNGVPGVSVGIVHDQELARSAHVGVSDLDDRRTAGDATLYRIASITKTFTATAIMQLRDEGRLSLDDPLVDHLPEFSAARNPFGPIEQVTLLRVLRHLSGLPGEMPGYDPRRWRPTGGPEVVRNLDRVSLAVRPDTAFKYSNLGYHLLGEVVTRRSGGPLAEYLRVAITDVLSMASTTFDPSSLADAHVATGYDRRGFDDRLTAARRVPVGESEGNGGLWSSVADLARWIAQQFRSGEDDRRGPGQVLDGPSLAEMHGPAVVAEPDFSAAHGLAWRMTRLLDTTIVQHGGLLNGFTSTIQFSPSERIGVIVLANGVSAPGSPTELGRRLLAREIAAARSTPPAAEQIARSAASPEAWHALLGRYVDPEFRGLATVGVRGGRLTLTYADDGVPFELSPTADPRRFLMTQGRYAGELLVVLQGADGRTNGLDVAGFPLTRLETVPE